MRETLRGVGTSAALRDVLDIDLAALDPPPRVMVANLPYGVATPVLIRALPTIERFCVMVQREIGERLFAAPGTKAYGAVSVLVQLVCERTGGRAVSRHVFVPQPNVDSMLVAFRRRPGVVSGRSGMDGPGRPRRLRPPPKDACKLAAPGRPAGAAAGVAGMRAEQLTPQRLGELARELRP